MRRLAAFLLLALSLVLSGPAIAAPSHDCPMVTSGGIAANHPDMGCCKLSCSSDCAVACPAAVEPLTIVAARPADSAEFKLAVQPAQALDSAFLSGIDPPPRTTFS